MRETPTPGQRPLYGKEWAVCFLVECILVVSMVTLILMQKLGTGPILCILHYVSITSIIFKTNVNGSLMLSVNRTLSNRDHF